MRGQDRRGDKIEPKAIEWLIDGFVPRGHISLIVGVAGYGKSTLAARWAADITNGHASGKAERVLVSNFEDHVEGVTVPRLKAAHARMAYTYPEKPYHFPRDLDEFEATLIKRKIKAVILDPLDDAIDNIGGQHGRQTLGELAGIAETTNAAIIGVHHFTKSGATIDRAIGGGRGVQGVARSIMILGPEPQEQLSPRASQEEREEHEEKGNNVILAHWKCNLGPLRGSLRYERTVVPSPADERQTVPVLNLADESLFTAEEVFAHGGGSRKAKEGTREQAKNLILALLADAPKNPTDLEIAVTSSGIGRGVFTKARAELAQQGEIEYQEFPANLWAVKVPDKPPTDWK